MIYDYCRREAKEAAIAIRGGTAGMGCFTAPVTVLRLLTALKMTYEAAKKRAEPDTKMVDVLPTMGRETVNLVNQAIGEKRRAYVLVNNRSKGNAPLTVQAIVDQL